MTIKIEMNDLYDRDKLRRCVQGASAGNSVIVRDGGTDVAVIVTKRAFDAVNALIGSFMAMPLGCWDGPLVAVSACLPQAIGADRREDAGVR